MNNLSRDVACYVSNPRATSQIHVLRLDDFMAGVSETLHATSLQCFLYAHYGEEKIFSSRGKNGNVALLPVTRLNFVYTRIFHPEPTSPDLLPLYRPLAEESIGIGHLHPTFSSFSIFLSLLLYIFFRKDIYYYISRAHDILKVR